MARPRKIVPTYRLHKARNCAVVRIDGRDHYLPGGYGSDESKRAYALLLAESERGSTPAPTPTSTAPVYAVGKLAVDYRRFADGYYRKHGQPTTQIGRVHYSLKALVELYEDLPAIEFGPLKLRNVQQHLVGKGYCRTYTNSLVGCIRLAFKWAAGEEKIPASIPEALRYVANLKRGRTTARESNPVLPVDEATVMETIKYVSPTVAAMVRVQLLTGMRTGEVCAMRPMDVTFAMDGTAVYRPESHKTEHHGRERRVYFGPQAVAILRPFLDRDPEAYCFSPRDSIAWRRERYRAERKTPLYPSHLARYERRRKRKARRAAGEQYTVCAYDRAIERGVEAAFGMPAELRNISPKLPEETRLERKRLAREWRRKHGWNAGQLRHSAATLLRKQFGIEAAQVTLGHASPGITLTYAERDFAKAAEIMRQIG